MGTGKLFCDPEKCKPNQTYANPGANIGQAGRLAGLNPHWPAPSGKTWTGVQAAACLSRVRRVRQRPAQALPDGDKRDVGVAFSLVAFFWRSKSKATRPPGGTGF